MIYAQQPAQYPVPLKKASVIFMIFVTIITCFIYPIYWFFNRAKQLNQLRSEKKITWEPTGVLIGLLVYIVCSICLKIIMQTLILKLLSSLLLVSAWLFSWIVYLRMIYRMRAILNDHFGEKRVGPILTFFFNIYYLQYHINRLIKSEMLANPQSAS